MKLIFDKIKQISAEGNYLAFITDGEGGVCVHVLSEKPDIKFQGFVDENGNEIESYGTIEEVDEKSKCFIEECLNKRKADLIRRRIEEMGDEDVVKRLSELV